MLITFLVFIAELVGLFLAVCLLIGLLRAIGQVIRAMLGSADRTLDQMGDGVASAWADSLIHNQPTLPAWARVLVAWFLALAGIWVALYLCGF